MSDLISNVLDLMRFESGQIQLRNDWQTLDELVESSLRRLEEPLARYNVELNLPADLPPVYVDASLITQVFTNLLDNIVKYTPPGTHIQIAAAVDDGGRGQPGSKVRVTVDDNGPGLPEGDPARLFAKFQRGTGEGTIVGVGLGLAICRAIIRAHGGEIEAQARTGGGARIQLTLPTVEPQ
jgi:two-component system sensor histidine kinase KdpD